MSFTLTTSTTEPLLIHHHSTMVIGESVTAHLCLENPADVELALMPHAKVSLYCLSSAGIRANIGKDAELTLVELGLQDDTSTRCFTVNLLESGASIHYAGLDQLLGQAHKKTELTINHRSPHTHSTQAFRGIYAHHAQASFLGKVVIEQSAAHSTASQLYKSILLSNDAKAWVMPQLEIYNYDIKASHGATIGQLDENALFYLCSRGLPLQMAQAFLINGLINDIVECIDEASLKSRYGKLVQDSVELALQGAGHD